MRKDARGRLEGALYHPGVRYRFLRFAFPDANTRASSYDAQGSARRTDEMPRPKRRRTTPVSYQPYRVALGIALKKIFECFSIYGHVVGYVCACVRARYN